MDLTAVAEAAIKLGVVPALLLFLVVSLHLQNRQLLRERRETEIELLKTMVRIISGYQRSSRPDSSSVDRSRLPGGTDDSED